MKLWLIDAVFATFQLGVLITMQLIFTQMVSCVTVFGVKEYVILELSLWIMTPGKTIRSFLICIHVVDNYNRL